MWRLCSGRMMAVLLAGARSNRSESVDAVTIIVGYEARPDTTNRRLVPLEGESSESGSRGRVYSIAWASGDESSAARAAARIGLTTNNAVAATARFAIVATTKTA